jgi:hypothetical protein
MRNFIAALVFAAFAQTLAYADESYTPEPNSTESALPVAEQSAEGEEAESTPSEDETISEESASQSAADLDV